MTKYENLSKNPELAEKMITKLEQQVVKLKKEISNDKTKATKVFNELQNIVFHLEGEIEDFEDRYEDLHKKYMSQRSKVYYWRKEAEKLRPQLKDVEFELDRIHNYRMIDGVKIDKYSSIVTRYSDRLLTTLRERAALLAGFIFMTVTALINIFL